MQFGFRLLFIDINLRPVFQSEHHHAAAVAVVYEVGQIVVAGGVGGVVCVVVVADAYVLDIKNFAGGLYQLVCRSLPHSQLLHQHGEIVALFYYAIVYRIQIYGDAVFIGQRRGVDFRLCACAFLHRLHRRFCLCRCSIFVSAAKRQEGRRQHPNHIF